MSALRAFGGAPLVGDRWVRILYLDESGIGNIANDPMLVVAGVIIHADTQWGVIARKLEDLLADATPFGVKRPQFLHAKDIFHGSGEFHRDKWPRDLRNELLESVGKLVSEYQLPVVWLGIDRKEYARDHVPNENAASQLESCYTVAATGCFMQAEVFMRQDHLSAEVCSILMEENRELQKRIPEIMVALRNPESELIESLPGIDRVLPLQKLIDTPACQPKTASSILQLADFCAFAIKRRLENRSGGPKLIAQIVENLMRYEWPDRRRDETFWNPVHMPSLWPNYPMKFENGQFKRADA